METLKNYLSSLNYPGRVIIIGKDKGEAFGIYIVTGRSQSSQSRKMEQKEDGSVEVVPLDMSKLVNPHLLIYKAYKKVGDTTFICNGDHMKEVSLSSGDDIFEKLQNVYPEDDPCHTPRIAAIIKNDKAYLAIVKDSLGQKETRQVYKYTLEEGLSYVIQTYDGKGDTTPFSGEPKVLLTEGIETQEDVIKIWDAVASDKKVALFSTIDNKIINKCDIEE
ncbi:MAG: hypothetical protein HUK24_03565 [Sphaerochaetaceae bacterium]|nr:hypothetical protein [Sphaerochaetaceae bacterium]